MKEDWNVSLCEIFKLWPRFPTVVIFQPWAQNQDRWPDICCVYHSHTQHFTDSKLLITKEQELCLSVVPVSHCGNLSPLGSFVWWEACRAHCHYLWIVLLQLGSCSKEHTYRPPIVWVCASVLIFLFLTPLASEIGDFHVRYWRQNHNFRTPPCEIQKTATTSGHLHVFGYSPINRNRWKTVSQDRKCGRGLPLWQSCFPSGISVILCQAAVAVSYMQSELTCMHTGIRGGAHSRVGPPAWTTSGCLLTLKVLVVTIDAQWEGMGDVGSARYEPALLPPCPTIRVLSYCN